MTCSGRAIPDSCCSLFHSSFIIHHSSFLHHLLLDHRHAKQIIEEARPSTALVLAGFSGNDQNHVARHTHRFSGCVGVDVRLDRARQEPQRRGVVLHRAGLQPAGGGGAGEDEEEMMNDE